MNLNENFDQNFTPLKIDIILIKICKKSLKILKLDFRPKFAQIEELPLEVNRGVPVHKLRYKILITYYL